MPIQLHEEQIEHESYTITVTVEADRGAGYAYALKKKTRVIEAVSRAVREVV